MKRAVLMGTVAAVCAAAGAAFIASVLPRAKPSFGPLAMSVAAAETGATIYFQDPDGKPFYSLSPKKTPDGRDWLAVPASADVNFDEADEQPAETKGVEAKTERKLKYYRNPMGLPDTSPVPKKDSMGMDYIPVYEGEDSDDGSVKLSPGEPARNPSRSYGNPSGR
jgi:membrane fusion protein, copper/silver efflux system